jgi:endonuclease YncB( thermonuclease family)
MNVHSMSTVLFSIILLTGKTVLVTIANVGERATPEATTRLKQLIENRSVTVLIGPSNRDATEVAGELRSGPIDVARQMLREGIVAFTAAQPYTISSYPECLHRIAEREAQNGRVGLWASAMPE